MDNFGIQIIGESGRFIIDRNGMLQTWVDSIADNLDGSNPLFLRFYLQDEIMDMQEFSLSFKTERFRSYTLSTLSSGVDTFISENSHSHGISSLGTNIESMSRVGATFTTWGGSGNQHSYVDTRLPGGFTYHDHTVSGSTGSSGSHSHGTVSHNHNLDFGIRVASANPGTMTIALQRPGSSSWINVSYSNPDETNLLPYFDLNNLHGWYTLRFSTDRLSRVTVSYLAQALVAVDIL